MSRLIETADAINALYELNNEHPFRNMKFSEVVNCISSLPPAKQWIPCSERLPEEDGQYLVTLDFAWGKEIEMGDWFIFEDGHGEWVNPNSHVTVAWMELPKPYDPQEK